MGGWIKVKWSEEDKGTCIQFGILLEGIRVNQDEEFKDSMYFNSPNITEEYSLEMSLDLNTISDQFQKQIDRKLFTNRHISFSLKDIKENVEVEDNISFSYRFKKNCAYCKPILVIDDNSFNIMAINLILE